ncbi:hypothetical protein [Nocardioides sp. SYSU D00038]|uniref:NmrA family NAD(P)-binding protein n=1 Tax=Nocardioides sp. SYSU D00038 TaxID=2812554 RepID=UPI001967A3EC|nr:hypothetical protein [Nocardioides sp. SYSU D00038]
MRHVLVTGMRAKTGAPLVDLLAADPRVVVRGGTSDPAAVHRDGVKPVAFSWDDPGSWAPAVEDLDALFVVRPDRADAPELIGHLLSLTPASTHVVLLSEFDPRYFAPDDWPPRTERSVRDSGRTWTILRPGWFMQVFSDPRFFLADVVDRGEIRFPSAGGSVAWIDTRDIAAVAAHALTEPGHHGRTYDLTGPEALTLPETAARLGRALGRPVRHVDIPLEEALAGSEGFDRANDEGAFDRIRRGLFASVTDVVERVTGRPARTFEQFAADEEAFHRLRPGDGRAASYRAVPSARSRSSLA